MVEKRNALQKRVGAMWMFRCAGGKERGDIRGAQSDFERLGKTVV